MAKKQKTPTIEKIYLILLFGIIIGMVWIWFMLMDYDERITNIECGLGLKGCSTAPAILSQPNPLEGWIEQCAENTTIFHNDTVGIIRFCKDGCNDEEGCISAFGEYNCNHPEECELQCQKLLKIPEYKLWNETICTKKILVKEERP